VESKEVVLKGFVPEFDRANCWFWNETVQEFDCMLTDVQYTKTDCPWITERGQTLMSITDGPGGPFPPLDEPSVGVDG
jgi:hypothetical protein